MSLKLQVSLIYKEQELHTECQDGGEHRSVCAVAGWGTCQQCLSHHWDPALASTWKDGQHRHLCSLQRGPSHPKNSEELFLLYFQVHCWGKASSITLEWTFLLSTASFCLGYTFACSLPSSGFSKRRLCMSAAFWSSPVPSIQLKYTQEEKLIPCLSAGKDKYLQVPQYSTAKVLLGEGSDHVLQVSSVPMTSLSLWTCPENTPGQACPHLTPKTESLHQSTASPTQMLFAV